MNQIQKISEKCNELRQKADGSSTTRVIFGIESGDVILSYHPQDNYIIISVVPNNFKQSSAEQIIDMVTKEFGRKYGDIEESESSAVVEYTRKIDWSHN